MTHESQNSRCIGQTKLGKPCRAAATEGGLCFFHANPNKATELGRIGGRSNRTAVPPSAVPLPKLDNLAAVRDTVARLIEDVYEGRVNPRIAAGLAPLMNLQMRAIEGANLEQRVANLEEKSRDNRPLSNLTPEERIDIMRKYAFPEPTDKAEHDLVYDEYRDLIRQIKESRDHGAAELGDIIHQEDHTAQPVEADGSQEAFAVEES